MKKYLIKIYIVISSIFVISGCASYRASNATVCNNVHFDYSDNFNDQNVREMLRFYCLCYDEKACL